MDDNENLIFKNQWLSIYNTFKFAVAACKNIQNELETKH